MGRFGGGLQPGCLRICSRLGRSWARNSSIHWISERASVSGHDTDGAVSTLVEHTPLYLEQKMVKKHFPGYKQL